VLITRILTSVVAVPILLAMAWDRGFWFLVGIFVVGLLGTAEALWVAGQAGHRPIVPFGLLIAIVILLDATLAAAPELTLSVPIAHSDAMLRDALGILLLLSLATLLLRTGHQTSLTDWALTWALPLYVAGLSQFFIPLRARADGGPLFMSWPGLVLMVSWACDIAAYFVGRAWGRSRLAPSISPAKSREGALAGIATATVIGGFFSFATGLGPLRMLGFGLTVGLASVLGDLVESLIKRQCGVKDSGFIMPGHGGLLDRMDALIFSAAASHFYLQAVA
jgi:phosphatidate cytidylyltransferase